jgi:enamine deaminase RidA (YjgF/YER057c/UK114 family)
MAAIIKIIPPARAAFAVKGLPLGVLVEIETIAVK